jgi:hypothetical protein
MAAPGWRTTPSLAPPVVAPQCSFIAGFDSGGFRQTLEVLGVAFLGVPSHNRLHRRIGFQCGRVDATNLLPCSNPARVTCRKYPAEHLLMRGLVQQPPRAADGHVVRRPLVQSDPQKLPQPLRIRYSPCHAARNLDPFEEPDQHHPEIDPRRQRRTPLLLVLILPPPRFAELGKACLMCIPTMWMVDSSAM